MADESEPDLFADERQAPPRALTRLSPLVRRLIAPNASPFTFNGTCTYVVGSGGVAVVDPGPNDDSHLAAILAAVEGESVETILVTHTHRDHSTLANRLREATDSVRAGGGPDPVVTAEEKRITRARRSVDKAASLLDGPPSARAASRAWRSASSRIR